MRIFRRGWRKEYIRGGFKWVFQSMTCVNWSGSSDMDLLTDFSVQPTMQDCL